MLRWGVALRIIPRALGDRELREDFVELLAQLTSEPLYFSEPNYSRSTDSFGRGGVILKDKMRVHDIFLPHTIKRY